MIRFVPSPSESVEKAATPALTGTGSPAGTPFVVNWTAPAGTPPLGAAPERVAVKVTLCPTSEGFAEVVRTPTAEALVIVN